jgi:Helix-turn-helix of DDE superfamily endonuclease
MLKWLKFKRILAMRYEKLKEFKDEEFRRLTGVKRTTFEKMVEILKEAEKKKKNVGGKPNKLVIEDRLLMALEYLREYRTYFHVAASYQISESACYRNIRWIEDVLIKHPDFALPGRKALLKSDVEYDVILIDATETPIERPKKNKKTTTQARKRDIH